MNRQRHEIVSDRYKIDRLELLINILKITPINYLIFYFYRLDTSSANILTYFKQL